MALGRKAACHLLSKELPVLPGENSPSAKFHSSAQVTGEDFICTSLFLILPAVHSSHERKSLGRDITILKVCPELLLVFKHSSGAEVSCQSALLTSCDVCIFSPLNTDVFNVVLPVNSEKVSSVTKEEGKYGRTHNYFLFCLRYRKDQQKSYWNSLCDLLKSRL